MNNETIAAISTALSESGIGIIRVSGPEAVEIVNKIFVGAKGKRILKKVASHTINYGHVFFHGCLPPRIEKKYVVVAACFLLWVSSPHGIFDCNISKRRESSCLPTPRFILKIRDFSRTGQR